MAKIRQFRAETLSYLRTLQLLAALHRSDAKGLKMTKDTVARRTTLKTVLFILEKFDVQITLELFRTGAVTWQVLQRCL